jgi:hypothetical protein
MQTLHIAPFEEYVFLRINSRQALHPYTFQKLVKLLTELDGTKEVTCHAIGLRIWSLKTPSNQRALKLAEFFATVQDTDVRGGFTNPGLDMFEKEVHTQQLDTKQILVYCIPVLHANVTKQLKRLTHVERVSIKWPYAYIAFSVDPLKSARRLLRKSPPVEAVTALLGLHKNTDRLVLPA